TATEFVDLSPDSDIYVTIEGHCAAIVPNAIIVISVFDRDSAKMVIRSVREARLPQDEGTNPAADLIGKEFFIPPALLDQLAHWVHFEQITPENASALFTCIEGEIPRITAIHANNHFYTISLISRQSLMGNFFFITPEKISPEDCALIEAYVHTAAGALRRRFAEDAQKMSEERFRSMADLSPFPVAIISPKGHYLYVNRQFTEVFGYTLQDVTTGKEWFEKAFPDPVLRDEATAVWKSDLAGSAIGRIRPRIFPVRSKNGKDREILFRPVTLADQNEYITYEDITEQRDAEKEIRAANQKMQDIIEFLPDPTLVIDNEKKVIAWNRAMEELTGVAREDMIGKGDHEYAIPFYGERRPMLIDIVDHPDPGIEPLYVSLWRPEEGVVIGEGFLPRFKKGEGLFAQGKASVLYNPQGERVGAIQSIRDLTHRKEMEEELRRSYAEMDQRVRERTDELAKTNIALENEIKRCNSIEVNLRQQESFYHTIAESFNDYIFVVDRKGRLKYVNPFMRSRFRLEKGDVTEGKNPDHFLEKYFEKLSLRVQSVFETGNLEHEELVTDTPSGEIILDTWLAPMRNDDGGPYAVLCIARDVTEFKRLQAKLAEKG
ncbi:MAG: PAS domain S-box protein, partial [Methanomicrobiales archaeon]|nr:PAS domain S-box protein [Methanomicrobiales archaeon]